MPIEWLLFALTLAAIALWSGRALAVSLCGLAAVSFYKVLGPGFMEGPGLRGLAVHTLARLGDLTDLFALLLGFSVVARHFEASEAPASLLRRLPRGWAGGLALLAFVFALSMFLDNIAAAVIGATLAHKAFGGKVHLGYLAAIVASANAGGAGSVLGDTTTMMLWIAGVPAHIVFDAFIASAAAFAVFAVPASLQQQRLSPMIAVTQAPRVDWTRLAGIAAALAAAVAANVLVARIAPHWEKWPTEAMALWAALLALAPARRPDLGALRRAAPGGLFLVALVLLASMMPVKNLPAPTWLSTFGLGWASALVDNIPLTALALKQGGYDWGGLAFAVGFGGSMVWFGSSAGVAVANAFPEARSVTRWVTAGWHVILGYVVGYFAWLWLSGWRP